MIGVFDSGVGGLSVWREIVRELPDVPTLYVADQAHVPYGPRPLEEVRRFAEGITRFLLAQGATVVVLACNTASAAALHHLRALFPQVPFVGMEPAVKPAVQRTRNGRVGVIATPATFQGELFASLLTRFGQDARHPAGLPGAGGGGGGRRAGGAGDGGAAAELPGAAAGGGDRRTGAGLHPLSVSAPADGAHRGAGVEIIDPRPGGGPPGPPGAGTSQCRQSAGGPGRPHVLHHRRPGAVCDCAGAVGGDTGEGTPPALGRGRDSAGGPAVAVNRRGRLGHFGAHSPGRMPVRNRFCVGGGAPTQNRFSLSPGISARA